MVKKNNFLFILTDKTEGASMTSMGNIYEARKDFDGDFTVGWHEYGFLKTVRYSEDDVATYLREGYWEMIAESEVEKFIKGLY